MSHLNRLLRLAVREGWMSDIGIVPFDASVEIARRWRRGTYPTQRADEAQLGNR
jgi:hypothetical protein